MEATLTLGVLAVGEKEGVASDADEDTTLGNPAMTSIPTHCLPCPYEGPKPRWASTYVQRNLIFLLEWLFSIFMYHHI